MPSLIFKMLIIMRTTILILLWWPIGSKFSFHNVKPHQCQTSSNLSSRAGWKTGQIKFVHGVFDHFEMGGFGLLIVKLRDIFSLTTFPSQTVWQIAPQVWLKLAPTIRQPIIAQQKRKGMLIPFGFVIHKYFYIFPVINSHMAFTKVWSAFHHYLREGWL